MGIGSKVWRIINWNECAVSIFEDEGISNGNGGGGGALVTGKARSEILC